MRFGSVSARVVKSQSSWGIRPNKSHPFRGKEGKGRNEDKKRHDEEIHVKTVVKVQGQEREEKTEN